MKTKQALIFRIFLVMLLFNFHSVISLGQTSPMPPDWNAMMFQPNANFFNITNSVDSFYSVYPLLKAEEEDDDENTNADLNYSNYLRWENFWRNRVQVDSSLHAGTFITPLQNYRQTFSNSAIYSCHQNGSGGSLNSNWTELGPFSMPCQNMGAIFNLAFDPTDISHNTLYAGTWSSGIWKTTSAQSPSPYWVPMQEPNGMPGLGIGDIAFSIQSGVKTLYVASGTSRGGYFGIGIYKSIDNGLHWSPTSLTLNASSIKPIFKILIDPNNPYIIWAFTPNEVYRLDELNNTNQLAYTYTSTQTIFKEQSKIIDMEFDPNNSNIIYISTNGFSIHAAGLNQGARMFKIIYNSGTFSSLDITPQPILGVFNLDWIGIATCPLNANIITAIYYDKTLNITKKNNFNVTSNTWQTSTSSNCVSYKFVISPVDASIYYAFGGAYGFKSVNSGASFSSITNYGACAEHGDVRVILFEQSNVGGTNDILWMGTDGGVSRKQGTAGWANKSGYGLNNLEFYGIGGFEGNSDLIVAGAQDNNNNKWTNPNWQHFGTGDGGDAIIDYSNQNHIYVLEGYQEVGESFNGLTSTNAYYYPTPPPNTDPWRLGMNMKIDPGNPNTIYVGIHELYRFNSGAGFQTPAMTSFSNDWINTLGISESNQNVMYVANNGPGWTNTPTNFLHKTVNAQSTVPTWTDVTPNVILPNNPFSYSSCTDIIIKPTDENTVWLTFGNFWDYKVVKTTDGGLTWTDYTQGLPQYPVNKIIYQKGSNDGLYVATDIGVYYRDNTMSQWECFNTHLPVCIVTDLEINYCTQKLRIATFGRGLWESPLQRATQTVSTANWTTPTKLYSDLIITGHLTITNSVDIAKGIKITIAPGGVLEISSNGHLFNGCNEMWDKINVDGATATLIIHNNAIVEDAYYGAYTINGGLIQIDHAHLSQNNVHIHLEGSPSTYTGFIYATIMDNSSGLQKPFLPGTASTNGIEIYNFGDVTIGNDQQANYANTISNFNNIGIFIESTSATIINNNINSNSLTNYSRGIAAYNSTQRYFIINVGARSGANSTAYSMNYLSNLSRGIDVVNNFMPFIYDNDLSAIRIRGIYITNCYREIHVSKNIKAKGNYIHKSPDLKIGIYTLYNPKVARLLIIENTLELNNNAIAIDDREYSCTDYHMSQINYNTITDTKYGIWLQNESTPLVGGNTINFIQPPLNSQIGYGIYAQNTCLPDIQGNKVTCTRLTKLLDGICAELCQNPNLCSNYIARVEKGIVCRGSMIGTKVKLNTMTENNIGFILESGGDIGEQGNSLTNDVSDNQWINNILYDTYSAGFSNLTSNTFFDVQSSGFPYNINTFNNDGTSLDVLSNVLGSANATACNDHKGWRVAKDAEDAIVNQASDTVISDEEKWIKQKQLFQIVMDDTSLNSSTNLVLNNFKNSIETEPIGDFKKVNNFIVSAFKDTLNIYPDSVVVDSARIKNSTVNDIKNTETYSKIVNEIYLSTIARNIFEFTPDQKSWLYNISSFCPFEAGQSVYQARVLTSLFDDDVIYFDDNCDPNAHLRLASNENIGINNSYFLLYPNPAKNVLFLDYLTSGDSKTIFKFFSASGKEVYTKILESKNNHSVIPTEQYSAGIYFYEIMNDNSILKTGKLNIIK